MSGSWDESVIVWDVVNGKQLQQLKGHSNNVTFVAFGSNMSLLSGSWDSTIRLWNANEKKSLQQCETSGYITCGALHPFEDVIVVGQNDRNLIFVKVQTMKELTVRFCDFTGLL